MTVGNTIFKDKCKEKKDFTFSFLLPTFSSWAIEILDSLVWVWPGTTIGLVFKPSSVGFYLYQITYFKIDTLEYKNKNQVTFLTVFFLAKVQYSCNEQHVFLICINNLLGNNIQIWIDLLHHISAKKWYKYNLEKIYVVLNYFATF